MRKLGYIRSITKDEELENQKIALKDEGCGLIFKDIVSSSKEERPGFNNLLDEIEKEDIVVVESLSKLANSVNQLIDTLNSIHRRGASVVSISEDTSTANQGNFLSSLLISIEKMNKERTKPGRKGAKARGRMGGRPEKLNAEQRLELVSLFKQNISTREICNTFGISRPTFYKYLKDVMGNDYLVV
jgi:DNA invertase Pin-like site-specific DNA recombinase